MKCRQRPVWAHRSRILCARLLSDGFQQQGYKTRSEAIRDLIRDRRVKQEGESSQETAGAITTVYNHSPRGFSTVLTRLQPEFYRMILFALPIHPDPHNRLEILAVRGKGNGLKGMSGRLIGAQGVNHGNLSLPPTGKYLDS